MPDPLRWNTIRQPLKDTLTKVMRSNIFRPFRLVGGTSLSLQIGHRMSVDIDLFTDAPYESIDIAKIDKFLRATFSYVSGLGQRPVGTGVSYLVGNSKNDNVKLDLFYTDNFIQPPLQIGSYRLATIEEIIAMKI